MKKALWITCGVRGNAGDALLHDVTRGLFADRVELDFRHVSAPSYLGRNDAAPENVMIGPGGLFVQTNSSRHLHAKLAKQWDRFESSTYYLWSTGILQEPSAEELAAIRRVTSRSPRIIVRATREAEFLRKAGPVTSPEWAPCTSLFADRLSDVADSTKDVVVVNFDSFLFTPDNIADHPLLRFRDFAASQGLEVRSMVNASGDSNRLMLDMFPLIDVDEPLFGDLLRAEKDGRDFHEAYNDALLRHPSFARRYTECRFAFGKRLHGWLPFLAYDKPAAFIGMGARRGMPKDYFGDNEFLCNVPRSTTMTRRQLEQTAEGMIATLTRYIAQEDALKARIATRREELWTQLKAQTDAFVHSLR